MNRRILIILLFLLSLSVTNAQLLWKISGNGLKHPSYLFGNQRFISIQFLDSVPGLYKAFNECNTVVGEVDINNIEATAKIQEAAIMPNHQNIKNLLNEEEYKLVDNELKSVLKFGLKEVSIMNPSLILTLYEMELYKKLTGLSEITQSDSYFQLVAAEKDKKIIGLETINQQIKILFGNSSLKRQAEILVESIQHKESILSEINKLNNLYKRGKIEELINLTKSKDNISKITQDEFVQLVDDRNSDWMTKLPTIIKNSSCFIAVGALHLGGKNGLIKLLEKAGFKVKAVN